MLLNKNSKGGISKGFTLIELMIVIAIIGIIVALVGGSISRKQEQDIQSIDVISQEEETINPSITQDEEINEGVVNNTTNEEEKKKEEEKEKENEEEDTFKPL